jgi:phosphomannomutase
MYFTDRWPGFDSGLYNGLRMLEILSKTNLEFSKLTAGTNSYHSIPETKVRVTDDTKFNIVKDVLESLNKVNQLPITNNVLPELIILYKSFEKLKNNINNIYNDFNSISNSATGKLLTDGLLLDYETYAIMVAKSLNTQYQIYKQSIKIIDTYNQTNNNNYTL